MDHQLHSLIQRFNVLQMVVSWCAQLQTWQCLLGAMQKFVFPSQFNTSLSIINRMTTSFISYHISFLYLQIWFLSSKRQIPPWDGLEDSSFLHRGQSLLYSQSLWRSINSFSLFCLQSHAIRHKRYIVPVISVHMDFYIRVFVRIFTLSPASASPWSL